MSARWKWCLGAVVLGVLLYGFDFTGASDPSKIFVSEIGSLSFAFGFLTLLASMRDRRGR